ncbi:MAG: hypothetical protein RBT80_16140 [Candidatus Vecturithrix sp.]|jgi:hypothetical protein|nr:hypothetical protein [Candidatus Vecturithrix sp.]
MKTFAEIEKEYESIPIDYVRDGTKTSGVFSLSRRKSDVILSSEQPLNFQAQENGWFDFRVKVADGKSILFHNALMAPGTRYHSWGVSQQCEEHIFPNIVVINPENLAENDGVSSLTFQILGLENFFHYMHVDRCSLHKLPSEDMDFLQRLVRKQSKPDTFFDPLDLYITHCPQQAFKFQRGKDIYEINFSATFSGGWGGKIQHSYYPIARIIFEKPRPIDDALDAIWEWKRFFSQMAMADLPVTAIAFYGTEESFKDEASVYLPNLKSVPEPDSEQDRFHPGDIPLNFWEDRDRLKDALSHWLSKNAARQEFRCLVSWVLKRMEQRFSSDDIITLCSAIESLDELTPEALPSKKDIRILVEGALAAAQSKNVDIGMDRLQGILSMLGKPGLPAKLGLLMDRVSPFVVKEDASQLIKLILKIRNMAAHGDFIHDTTMPLDGPITEALAGVCVLFDLLDCGVPIEAHPHSLICPAQRIKAALVAIKKINAVA